jgi:hypothetical protein
VHGLRQTYHRLINRFSTHPMVHLGDEAQLDARFGPSGYSANLDARLVHGSMLNIPQAQKSFWTHQMEHLGDLGHVESHFGPFGESLSIGARRVHGLRQAYHRLENCFGHTR